MSIEPATADFDGFSDIAFTPIPDEVFDLFLAFLTGAELKTLMYIMRRTYGFKKNEDAISLSQICDGIQTQGEVLDYGTGLSRRAAIEALSGLETKGLIVKTRQQHHRTGGNIATLYLVKKSNQPSAKKSLPWCKKVTSLVQKSNPQYTVKQETVEQETVQQSELRARVSENLTLSDGQIEAEVQRLDNSSPPPPSHLIVGSCYEAAQDDTPCKISDVNEVAGLYNRAKGTKKLNRSEKTLLEQAIEKQPDLAWMGAMQAFLEDDYWREQRFPLRGFLAQASKYAEKASVRSDGEDEAPSMVVGGRPDSPIAPRGSNGSIRPSVPIPDKSAELLARWNELVSEPLRVKYTDDPYYPAAKLREAAKLPRFTDNFDTIARKCDEYHRIGTTLAFERLFEPVKDKPLWVRILDGFFDGIVKGKQPQQHKSGAQGLLERMKQEQLKKEQIAA